MLQKRNLMRLFGGYMNGRAHERMDWVPLYRSIKNGSLNRSLIQPFIWRIIPSHISCNVSVSLPLSSLTALLVCTDFCIHVCYCLIARETFDGSRPGSLDIKPDQLNDDVFNYIFVRGP